ncbi:lipocalin family protein [Rubrimonas cliftonensis]|uniref:Outer membrane lipoprotein Blc n=1 Tax=Rubrimonas cliftonensis TaxID=89524 RepID=A0A1H3YS87_9RHOB|nr:lipocalin family protein [Rubrimonas cliftonensis]SEA14415.1 apolipoprotein D and lipocalin family protein [Rubrimonas cliftonensis]
MQRMTAAAGCLALAACTGAPDGVTPVTGFQPERYAGEWFEIYRLDHSFERGLTNVTATYALREDGRLSVVNRGWSPDDCAFDSVEGTARPIGAPGEASLAVTFFWPFAGGYHLFALDREDYAWAAVSGPTREYLWILAREPALDAETDAALRAQAARLGFDTDALIAVSHGAPVCDDG